MKKILIIVLFLVTTTLKSILAQEVIYDYSTSKMTIANKAIKSGEFITLKIKNVSTFRYKVEIKGTTVNYVTPIPSELEALFRLSSSGESSSKKNQEALSDIASAVGLMDGEKKGSSDNVDLAIGNKGVVNSEIDSKSDEIKKKEADLKVAVSSEDRKKIQGDLDKLKSELTDLKKQVDDIPKQEVLQASLDDLATACKYYLSIARKMGGLKMRRMQLLNVAAQKWKDASTMQSNAPVPLSKSGMEKDYDDFIDYYAQAEALYTKAKQAAVALNSEEGKSTKKIIDNAEKLLLQGHYKINEDDLLKIIGEIDLMQNAIQNADMYFEVTTAPVQADGDFVRFEISIIPARVDNPLPYESAKTSVIEVPVQGSFRVDFSVGPALSFGGDSRDDRYYFEPPAANDTVNTGLLKQRDNLNATSPHIMAMMHFYRRSNNSNFSWGGLFGVGAGFQQLGTPSVSFVGGVSGVLGKTQKVMLNAGVSLLQVNRLKTDQFQRDKKYPIATKIEDVTESVFKPSLFLGISYNLSQRQEIK